MCHSFAGLFHWSWRAALRLRGESMPQIHRAILMEPKPQGRLPRRVESTGIAHSALNKSILAQEPQRPEAGPTSAAQIPSN